MMSHEPEHTPSDMTRRQYLKTSAGIAAAAVVGTTNWARGANERIGIGFIGTRQRCQGAAKDQD